MEFKAIGLIEVNSVANGVKCADDMLKAADVELLIARPTCPGRYLAMIAGDVGSVQSAVETGRETAGEFIVDSFIIPNVHEAIFPALSCASKVSGKGAIGIIETYSAASTITAADEAVKSAAVQLIEIRCASGLAGKSFVTLSGDVGSVNAAVEAGVQSLADEGMVQSHVVIPAPSRELYSCLI